MIALISLPLAWWVYEPYRLTHELNNDDVSWDGSYFGLIPHCDGKSARSLLKVGRRATPALMAALEDREKFAAAHVILTELWQYSFSISGSHWNGLRVTLSANGETGFYAEQIPELRRQWAAIVEE